MIRFAGETRWEKMTLRRDGQLEIKRRMRVNVQGQGRKLFKLIIKRGDGFAKPFFDKGRAPAAAFSGLQLHLRILLANWQRYGPKGHRYAALFQGVETLCSLRIFRSTTVVPGHSITAVRNSLGTRTMPTLMPVLQMNGAD